MQDIAGKLQALMEDRTGLIITDEIIKEYILDNIDILVEEIKEEI